MKKSLRLLFFLTMMVACFVYGCDSDTDGIYGCDALGSDSGNGCSDGSRGDDDSDGDDGIDGDNAMTVHLEGRIYEGGFNLSSTVYLRDSALVTRSTQSDSNGSFVFDEDNLMPPYILWARLMPTTPEGYETTFYTTCGDSGTVNISSLTHMVSAMALGRNPINLYRANPDAPAPAADKVAAGQQVIHNLLALVYADLGIAPDIDLMTVDIDDAASGYRRILDMVRGHTGSSYVALYPRPYERPKLMIDFLTDAHPDETVGPEAAWIQLMGMIAAADYFACLNGVVKDDVVDSREQRALISRWAPDFLNRGVGPDQIADTFSKGDPERLGVHEIAYFEFIRPMFGLDDHPLGALGDIGEKGNYERGFWCRVACKDRDLLFEKMFSFVYSQGQWLVFGDRSPFNTPFTIQTAGIRVDRKHFFTGLKLSIEDTDMAGQNRGIRKVAVFNSALPAIDNPVGEGAASAMILAPHRYGLSDNLFRIAAPADYTQRWFRTFYLTEDGLDIRKMFNGKDYNYFHVALDENGTPIYTWVAFMQATPLEITELKQQADLFQVFPTMTELEGSSGALNIIDPGDASGRLNISWKNPGDPEGFVKTMGARIQWLNWENDDIIVAGAHDLNNPAVRFKKIMYGHWSSATFTSPPAAWEGEIADIDVWSIDRFGELFVDINLIEVRPDRARHPDDCRPHSIVKWIQ